MDRRDKDQKQSSLPSPLIPLLQTSPTAPRDSSTRTTLPAPDVAEEVEDPAVERHPFPPPSASYLMRPPPPYHRPSPTREYEQDPIRRGAPVYPTYEAEASGEELTRGSSSIRPSGLGGRSSGSSPIPHGRPVRSDPLYYASPAPQLRVSPSYSYLHLAAQDPSHALGWRDRSARPSSPTRPRHPQSVERGERRPEYSQRISPVHDYTQRISPAQDYAHRISPAQEYARYDDQRGPYPQYGRAETETYIGEQAGPPPISYSERHRRHIYPEGQSSGMVGESLYPDSQPSHESVVLPPLVGPSTWTPRDRSSSGWSSGTSDFPSRFPSVPASLTPQESVDDDYDDDDEYTERPAKRRKAQDKDNPKPKVQKKTAIACNFCRGRKLRCDGKVPCSSCSSREDQECVYAQQQRRRGKGRASKGVGSKKGTPRASQSSSQEGHQTGEIERERLSLSRSREPERIPPPPPPPTSHPSNPYPTYRPQPSEENSSSDTVTPRGRSRKRTKELSPKREQDT